MTVSLVTGGAGFIGSHVAGELIKLNHRVIVLDDLSGGFEENIPDGAIFINGSITNVKLIEDIFNKYEFDYVYHFAAYAAEGLSHFIKRFNYENNLIGSINLINESVKHKIKCFVFTSSIAVYGSTEPPMIESTTPKPEDPYAIAKYAVEQDLMATKEMFGLNYIIFRPHNVYGEKQNLGDKYRNVIGIFINQIRQNKPLTIFGDGKQTRAFSYIGDMAFSMANSINIKEAKNQVFNVGADEEYTIIELANAVLKSMKTSGEIRHVEARNEVVHAWANHDKFNSILKPNSFTSLPEGLNKMIAWAYKTGTKPASKFENIEIYENLPPIWLE